MRGPQPVSQLETYAGVVPAENMDNKIFRQYLPDANITEDTEGACCVRGNYKAGDTFVPVTIDLKQRDSTGVIKIKAEKEYDFEILPANCDVFNQEALAEYGNTYHIYGHRNTFYMTKKTLLEPGNGPQDICEEFFNILSDAAGLFEKRCVNFMRKYTEQEPQREHSLDPELKVKDKEETAAVMNEESGLVHLFMARQYSIAETALKKQAEKYGAEIEMAENSKSFHTEAEGRELTMTLEDDATDIMIELSETMPAVRGYAFICNAKATYPEFSVTYDDTGKLHACAYMTPDAFLPDEENETVKSLLSAYAVCDKLTETTEVDETAISMDIHGIMENQMEDLKKREAALKEWESRNRKTETEVQAKADQYELEKKKQVAVIQKKILELNEKENALKKQEEELKKQKKEDDTEKLQYKQQLENMVMELKQMRARAENVSAGVQAPIEIQRLQAKITSITKSRAAMEEQLQRELQASQTMARKLMKEVQDKENQIADMERNLKSQANQLFQEERESYEKTICALKERANITDQDINVSSFKTYLDEKTEYAGSVIQHGKDKEIVSIAVENYMIKVVFGELLFADVTKTFRRVVDMKTMAKMNSQYTDIKFFSSGRTAVTARKYFRRQILNMDLVQIIRDLVSKFV